MCPVCGPDLDGVAMYSKDLSKTIYMKHTMYLDPTHPMRKDGEYYLDVDIGADDIWIQPMEKTPAYWKMIWDRIYDPSDTLVFERSGITRRSILWDLSYWNEFDLHHLLDPMHIEGNIGKSLIKHMYGEKTKNWRESCVSTNVHPSLWEFDDDLGNPSPPWILSRAERKEFRRRIAEMRMPSNYGANLQRAFGDHDPHNWPGFLKTHDYHRLLHDIIPVAIIGLGSQELQEALWDLGKLLRWVCEKEIKVDEIATAKQFGVEVVCKLERAFPPSFFDGQVHLLIHLVREISIAGPVHARWMYWVERYMHFIKKQVRNKAQVEGSIGEGYLASESMFYCSNILATIDPSCPRVWENNKDMDEEEDRLAGATVSRRLSNIEMSQVISFVLANSLASEDWRDFYERKKLTHRRGSTFPRFDDYMISKLSEYDNLVTRGESVSHFPSISDELRCLVRGPLREVITRTGMHSDGRHFQIQRLDVNRKVTFNCGVMGSFTTDS